MQPDRPARITLHIVRGRASQQSREMTGPTLLIGSDSRCDVQMRSPAVAAKHGMITRRDDRAILTRLSADHDILLNGRSIAEEELNDGDVIALGPFELRVEFGGEAGAADSKKSALALEPRAVNRPRFALLDRRAPSPRPAPPIPIPPAATTTRTGRAAPPTHPSDARLQEWEKRLQRDESEIAEARAELTSALEDCKKQRKVLEERRARLAAVRSRQRSRRRELQSRFANLSTDSEQRGRELAEREATMLRREERWRRAAAEVDARAEAVQLRARETTEALADLERRRHELRLERARLDREWQRLSAGRREIAEEKADLVRRTERVSADEAFIAAARQRSESELQQAQRLGERTTARAAEVDAKAVRLHGRERELDGRSQVLAGVDQSLRRREMQLQTEVQEIHRRAAEVKRLSAAEQRDVEQRRAQLESEQRRHDEEKRSLQERQAACKAAMAGLGEVKLELDRRASLLAAKERSLAESEQRRHTAAEIEKRFEELRDEQAKLTVEVGAAAARRKTLDAETAKLAEIAAELATRQRELLARERQLAASAAERHEELDQKAQRLEAEQAALIERAEEQRRRWERLKTSAARMGNRRKVLLERLSDLETRFEGCKKEIEELVESRRRLRASLDQLTQQAQQRERTALEWLRGVRAESDAVADAHRRFTRQFEAAVGSAAPSGLRASLGHWSSRMSRLHRRIEAGDRALRAPILHAEGAATAISRRALCVSDGSPPSKTPVADALGSPKLMKELGVTRASPPRWLFQLAELGLADEEVLNYLLVNALQQKTSVEDALVDHGVVSRYQIECVAENRTDELQIGPAKVLDRLHRGALADVFKAMLPELEKAVVLRLLHAKAAASDAARSAYLEHVQRAMRFRHPSSASVLGPFQHRDRVGVLVEFVAGEPLDRAAAALSPKGIMTCFRECLGALFVGQRAGMVHGSLKPSRILATPAGRIVLLGFGEPAWLHRLQRCAKGPSVADYLAPEERVGGRQIDARADLFALCRIFLEVLLGRRPAPGEMVAAPPGYPDAFLGLLIRGIQNDPGARCRSFAEVVIEVDRLLATGSEADKTPAARAA